MFYMEYKGSRKALENLGKLFGQVVEFIYHDVTYIPTCVVVENNFPLVKPNME